MVNVIIVLLVLVAFWYLNKLRNPLVDFSLDTEGGIVFHKGSWSEALEMAQSKNKPIFLDIYATWCGPCKMLKKYTFADKEAGDYFNQNFINVALDGEKDEGAILAQQFGVNAYPTLLFIDSNGRLISKSPGYRTATDLVKTAQELEK